MPRGAPHPRVGINLRAEPMEAGLGRRCRVPSAMKSSRRTLALLFWDGTAYRYAEAAIAAPLLGLGAVRIASDVDQLAHWVTHG